MGMIDIYFFEFPKLNIDTMTLLLAFSDALPIPVQVPPTSTLS